MWNLTTNTWCMPQVKTNDHYFQQYHNIQKSPIWSLKNNYIHLRAIPPVLSDLTNQNWVKKNRFSKMVLEQQNLIPATEECNKFDLTVAPYLRSANHYNWSRWFAIGSLPSTCSPSFNLMAGIEGKKKTTLNLDARIFLQGHPAHSWRCSYRVNIAVCKLITSFTTLGMLFPHPLVTTNNVWIKKILHVATIQHLRYHLHVPLPAIPSIWK